MATWLYHSKRGPVLFKDNDADQAELKRLEQNHSEGDDIHWQDTPWTQDDLDDLDNHLGHLKDLDELRSKEAYERAQAAAAKAQDEDAKAQAASDAAKAQVEAEAEAKLAEAAAAIVKSQEELQTAKVVKAKSK